MTETTHRRPEQMTLRDQFAMAALVVAYADLKADETEEVGRELRGFSLRVGDHAFTAPAHLAALAYEIADEMLAARQVVHTDTKARSHD